MLQEGGEEVGDLLEEEVVGQVIEDHGIGGVDCVGL